MEADNLFGVSEVGLEFYLREHWLLIRHLEIEPCCSRDSAYVCWWERVWRRSPQEKLQDRHVKGLVKLYNVWFLTPDSVLIVRLKMC